MNNRCNPRLAGLATLAALIVFAGCSGPSSRTTPPPPPSRASAIPAAAVKCGPAIDVYPPILHSDEFQLPVPLGSPVNTAGAEDSPFIMPDGNTLYFFFTPDVTVPPEKQLLDGVTGIWVATKQQDTWGEPRRVVLQERNELSLDGAEFVNDTEFWFASARKGNFRGVDLWTATLRDGQWTDWRNAGKKLNVDFDVGEMHINAVGNEMYFHSPRVGGKGKYDIWVTRKAGVEWQEPENVTAVNTPETEGWPYVTRDGLELWFLRDYMGSPGVFRSQKKGSQWGEPELIVSQFAGEPTLDDQGNLYFVHHFYKDGKMIEADIYVAYRK